MALPSSPNTITAAMINKELGRAENAPFNLNDTEVRKLAGKPSGTIAFSDFWGKSALQNLEIVLASSITADLYEVAANLQFNRNGWIELWSINSDTSEEFKVKDLTRWLAVGSPEYTGDHSQYLTIELSNIARPIGSDSLVLSGNKYQRISGTTSTKYSDTGYNGVYAFQVILDAGYSESMYTYTMKLTYSKDGYTSTKTANVIHRARG